MSSLLLWHQDRLEQLVSVLLWCITNWLFVLYYFNLCASVHHWQQNLRSCSLGCVRKNKYKNKEFFTTALLCLELSFTFFISLFQCKDYLWTQPILLSCLKTCKIVASTKRLILLNLAMFTFLPHDAHSRCPRSFNSQTFWVASRLKALYICKWNGHVLFMAMIWPTVRGKPSKILIAVG